MNHMGVEDTYEPPKLTHYGNISTLTAASNFGTKLDSGFVYGTQAQPDTDGDGTANILSSV